MKMIQQSYKDKIQHNNLQDSHKMVAQGPGYFKWMSRVGVSGYHFCISAGGCERPARRPWVCM